METHIAGLLAWQSDQHIFAPRYLVGLSIVALLISSSLGAHLDTASPYSCFNINIISVILP